jgi:hypothetical protein
MYDSDWHEKQQQKSRRDAKNDLPARRNPEIHSGRDVAPIFQGGRPLFSDDIFLFHGLA